MTNVIELFVVDEITGLKVPNKRYSTEYVIVVGQYGEAIFPTYQKALERLHQYPGGVIVPM
jgi:hypothetical protein